MVVRDKDTAFLEAGKRMKHDFQYDSVASENAGYPIYKSVCDDCPEWISDLNTRLEVNLEDGTSFNIWIERIEYRKSDILSKLVANAQAFGYTAF